MMAMLATLTSLAAFAVLSLAMERHAGQLFRRRPRPCQLRCCRLGGWCLMALPPVLWTVDLGWKLGPIAWCADLMVTGLLWVGILTLLEMRSS